MIISSTFFDVFLTSKKHEISHVTSYGDSEGPPNLIYVKYPFLVIFISDSIFCTLVYLPKMGSSELIKSHSPFYVSTLPKTAICSDFVCPQSSEFVPIGGLDFANLVYIITRRWRLLAVSVTQFMVLIGSR